MGPHDDPITLTHTANTSNRLPDKVQTYPSFSISWQYQTGSVFDPPNWSGWTAFGTSTNCVYVSLDEPAATLYRTVVHTACKNSGASNATMAVASVWQAFNGPAHVKNWSGDPLYYYQPGYSFSDHQDSLWALLEYKRGQCGAWQEFFSECLLVHNLWATYVFATIPFGSTDSGFIMKNWMERDPTMNLPYAWQLSFAAPDAEMVPIPWDYDFGGLIIRSGIAGQGSGSTFPASPSERVFTAHKLVQYGNTYYDPSYGTIYTGPNNMESDALDGFWRNLQNIGSGSTIDRRRKSSGGLSF